MRLSTFEQLRPLLELDSLNADLLSEAFKLLDYGHHYIWVDISELEAKATTYATQQGWDPQTTLVLYSLPTPPQPVDPDKEIDLDDFDVQIGTLNPTQAVCSLYPNLTVEKLAETLNRVSRMKAFL